MSALWKGVVVLNGSRRRRIYLVRAPSSNAAKDLILKDVVEDGLVGHFKKEPKRAYEWRSR